MRCPVLVPMMPTLVAILLLLGLEMCLAVQDDIGQFVEGGFYKRPSNPLPFLGGRYYPMDARRHTVKGAPRMHLFSGGRQRGRFYPKYPETKHCFTDGEYYVYSPEAKAEKFAPDWVQERAVLEDRIVAMHRWVLPIGIETNGAVKVIAREIYWARREDQDHIRERFVSGKSLVFGSPRWPIEIVNPKLVKWQVSLFTDPIYHVPFLHPRWIPISDIPWRPTTVAEHEKVPLSPIEIERTIRAANAELKLSLGRRETDILSKHLRMLRRMDETRVRKVHDTIAKRRGGRTRRTGDALSVRVVRDALDLPTAFSTEVLDKTDQGPSRS